MRAWTEGRENFKIFHFIKAKTLKILGNAICQRIDAFNCGVREDS